MKKMKAYVSDIPSYHQYRMAFYNPKNGLLHSCGNGEGLYRGYLYTLSDKLSQERKEQLLNRYNNVMLYSVQSEYAPEIVKNAIFISERVLPIV
jgi:hypothetical protein